MKKLLSALLVVVLVLSVFCGCGAKKEEGKAELTVIKVGATPRPHAEMLEQVKEALAEKGFDLQIIEYNDYIIPNTATEDGELDANFFQHQPYLTDFNEQNGTHLVAVAAIHYEPYGLYPGKTAAIADLADGAQIAIPNDGTNEARALMLLEAQGLIKLKDDVGFTATILDIAENPKNLDIIELEAAQLPRSLQDVDMAVINGNYAMEAGLSVMKDAVATEDVESIAAQTYANVLVVKEGNENNEGILALAEALQSEAVKQFILDEYDGAVVPMF